MRCGLILLVWFSVLLTGSQAGESTARYFEAQWQLDSPLGASRGLLIGLIGPSGWWRIEIGLGNGETDCSAADIMRRRGEGWTLASAHGDGFRQAWHKPWTPIGPRSTAALEQLLFFWSSGQHGVADHQDPQARRWRRPPCSGNTGMESVNMQDLEVVGVVDSEVSARLQRNLGDLRRRLVVRGHGRGGEGVRLQLRRAGSAVVVSSTRWPGRLTLTSKAEDPVIVPADAYLPLWPLADFLP